MMTKEWSVTLRVCGVWVGEMSSYMSSRIHVCVVVVVALMVVMGVVVLMEAAGIVMLVIVVRVSCIGVLGVVGVLCIRVLEVDCAGVVDILVLGEVFVVEMVEGLELVVRVVVRCEWEGKRFGSL